MAALTSDPVTVTTASLLPDGHNESKYLVYPSNPEYWAVYAEGTSTSSPRCYFSRRMYFTTPNTSEASKFLTIDEIVAAYWGGDPNVDPQNFTRDTTPARSVNALGALYVWGNGVATSTSTRFQVVTAASNTRDVWLDQSCPVWKWMGFSDSQINSLIAANTTVTADNAPFFPDLRRIRFDGNADTRGVWVAPGWGKNRSIQFAERVHYPIMTSWRRPVFYCELDETKVGVGVSTLMPPATVFYSFDSVNGIGVSGSQIVPLGANGIGKWMVLFTCDVFSTYTVSTNVEGVVPELRCFPGTGAIFPYNIELSSRPTDTFTTYNTYTTLHARTVIEFIDTTGYIECRAFRATSADQFESSRSPRVVLIKI